MSDDPALVRQLPLPFEEPVAFSADDFIAAASNQAARTALGSPESWVNRRLVLWGEAGCGKSHLAQIWAAERQASTVMASGLRAPFSAVGSALVIEDIDATISPGALFATLERAQAGQQALLLTSRMPPARIAFGLADLESRLRASLTIRIEPAEPALLETLLLRLASDRQMDLPATLGQFMLNRLPRRPAILREAIARLDRYSLALGTAPSRRIAEYLLEELADPPETERSPPEPRHGIENHRTDMSSLL